MGTKEETSTSPTRQLGRSGPQITQVGFGAWALGGPGWAYTWGAQDDRESIAAIKHAVARGVNWIDTAAVYGYGHSEEMVGRALKEMPAGERPLVFTKCGLRWYEDDRLREPQHDLRPAAIRAELEDSLRRLGVDQIDLYQFHWPDETDTPVEESWGELSRLVEAGKVVYAGVSNFGVELLERAEKIRHVDSLQPPFSLIEREAGLHLLAWTRAHGTGVIVYSPMQSGLLTGRFSAERVSDLPADDWRRLDVEFQEPNLSRNLTLVEALKPVAVRRGATVPEVAVAWVLSWKGVTGAIVGARSPEQVDGWIEAPLRKLTDEDLDEIAVELLRSGAGRGPVNDVQ
ncbi:MAG: aldo/keto reductase [Candidatus Dormibacteraeota bacterium]|nr:aldo/keto reductase [Candidatus Dormibacteraeota bacterium]